MVVALAAAAYERLQIFSPEEAIRAHWASCSCLPACFCNQHHQWLLLLLLLLVTAGHPA
jgi:hypothetical protein